MSIVPFKKKSGPSAAFRDVTRAIWGALKPVDQRRTRSPRDGLAHVTPISPPDSWPDQGVSEDESAALTGTPREETDLDSFWRFG